ncbi:hypothetical protein PMIN01_08484 [Paraphaeosphaeria minitans]|uniref:Uncharacterized protein n=1 Tax=Paraphaeosphaeria minitans TaxID=565426 RepID=A0A9P6KPV2_9PLEO|nr:hypothetical protein PMIN01_08484 [Paraphaeosphaeria minitans]
MVPYRIFAASALTVRACNMKINEIDRWKLRVWAAWQGCSEDRWSQCADDDKAGLEPVPQATPRRWYDVGFVCRATRCTTLPRVLLQGAANGSPAPALDTLTNCTAIHTSVWVVGGVQILYTVRCSAICDARQITEAAWELGPEVFKRRNIFQDHRSEGRQRAATRTLNPSTVVLLSKPLPHRNTPQPWNQVQINASFYLFTIAPIHP